MSEHDERRSLKKKFAQCARLAMRDIIEEHIDSIT
jgi:hypothetical protein